MEGVHRLGYYLPEIRGRCVVPRALVTGANRGIGLALCAELSRQEWEVLGCVRGPCVELEEQGVKQEVLDLGSDASIAELSQRLAGVPLDLVVHNAGINVNDDLAHLDSKALARQYRVNALGPLLLTSALMANLSRGSKVVMVSSRMGSLGDNKTGRQYGYRASKAAMNMIGVNLSRDLAPHGIAVGILHPGFVRTDMTRGRGERGPEEAAPGLVARIQELTLASSGSFWHADGRALPW